MSFLSYQAILWIIWTETSKHATHYFSKESKLVLPVLVEKQNNGMQTILYGLGQNN